MGCLWAAAAGLACGDLVDVPTSAGEAFSLDVDGDGEPELSGLWFTEWGGEWSVTVGIRVDPTEEVPTLADQGFVGVFAEGGSSLEVLASTQVFEPLFHPPGSTLRRDPVAVSGGVVLSAAEPVVGSWSYGTAGVDDEPVHLIGLVVDATAAFASNGAEAVRIHYRDFGSFAGGEAPLILGLAATGAPFASPPPSVEFDFPEPKRVRASVSSVLGMTYRLQRRAGAGEWSVIETRPGTGRPMVVEWDDALAASDAALFRIEERVGE